MLNRAKGGFSLIEMLVALTITAVLLAVFVSMFSALVQRTKTTVNTQRLDQSLQAALSLMANDIRRAGFWGSATTNIHTHTNINPFNTNDVSINVGGDCLLLTYDQNGDGALPSIGAGTDDERYGYRLMNGAIQARPSGASYSCGALAGAWLNITDPNVVQITALSFSQTNRIVTISSPATPTMTVRSVVISISGRLTANTSVTKTISEQIRIRNDKYAP